MLEFNKEIGDEEIDQIDQIDELLDMKGPPVSTVNYSPAVETPHMFLNTVLY